MADNDRPSAGKMHPRNHLNHLTGKEWLAFTRSWFVHNPPPRTKAQIKHPAKFPEPMIEEFIAFFTRKGETVLDPFMGVGSTLSAAAALGRRGVGIELNSDYYHLACQHGESPHNILINGDASEIETLWRTYNPGPVHFIITSPPYWDMLSQSRGNVFSTHKKRKAEGLDTVYSVHDSRDMGTIKDYHAFLDRLAGLFHMLYPLLESGRYMVIIIQNLRSPEGRMVPLAWDLTQRLSTQYVFKGEKIWCQDNKKLGIWGYPSEFVLNVHHHYCLIFKKEQGLPGVIRDLPPLT